MEFVPILPYFTQQLLLLSVVVLVKMLLQRLIPHQPFQFFRFYCEKLADKVNNPSNSDGQQRIAGFVAFIITFAPLFVIAWLFEMFVEIPELWHAFLLYLALGNANISVISKKVAQAVVANNNYLAKQLLAPSVLRDTASLSSMGICKTCIEMVLLKNIQEMLVVACLFLLFGPLAALSFRLILEMHYSWNIKRKQFYNFGASINAVVQFIQWLPIRLFALIALIMSIGQNTLLFWRLIRGYFFAFNNNIALEIFALNLKIKLGGVAIYDGEKLRRTAFNDKSRQPEPADVIHANNFMQRFFIIFAIILIAIATLEILFNGISA